MRTVSGISVPGATAMGRSRSARAMPSAASDRAARVILVGERRAEERHEAVAEELVDRALVAMHLGERDLEEAR